MSKGYHTVIELEHLDDFFNGTGDFNGMTVAILMYTAHQLNKQEEFAGKFNFEVICFGWMGYYPAIGVEYLQGEILASDERETVTTAANSFFEKLLATVSVFELIEFSQQNLAAISLVLKDIKHENDEYYKRAATGKWWMS